MTIRFYLDEDSMDRALIRALRARGADVLTAFEAGMIEKEDEHHLERAATENRLLFSFNLVGSESVFEESDLGSTGYQPVPSGNLPDGTGAASPMRSGAGFVATLIAVPVGRLPTGAGW